ncbi:L domain-like protein [Neocallimastix californiae]|uniref:L domain-like protein n=1 Tax=Neocallimastix californiae TaxID=1754190 RepID=A0A1Y2EQ87_9FUNG|nr:L domain-like protein [Neocallimastix californiae]|eukprot:ORY73753.1 L domain-like protein [Neocallimastix californiae]
MKLSRIIIYLSYICIVITLNTPYYFKLNKNGIKKINRSSDNSEESFKNNVFNENSSKQNNQKVTLNNNIEKRNGINDYGFKHFLNKHNNKINNSNKLYNNSSYQSSKLTNKQLVASTCQPVTSTIVLEKPTIITTTVVSTTIKTETVTLISIQTETIDNLNKITQPINAVNSFPLANTDEFIILKSSSCINLLNKYFKPNINIYFENNITIITSSQGFVINNKAISDCLENVSSDIQSSNTKLMSYDPKYGLIIGKKYYRVERVVDFSCKFENKKAKIDFPIEKTIWYSLSNNNNITTYYDRKSMTCIGNQCPLLYECTSRNPSDLIDISFNYYDNKLLIKNYQNKIDIYTNNSDIKAILTILAKLNIIILILRNCSLTSNLLENISYLKNLKKLDISYNSITTGLKYVTVLNYIEYIDISYNNISDNISLLQNARLTLLTFIASNTSIKGNINIMRDLYKIKKIDLSKTNIFGDISYYNNSSIKDISMTSIKGDVNDIFSISYNLEYINISNTLINGKLQSNIYGLQKLKSINFSNTAISGNLSKNIKNLKNLKEINISQTNANGIIPSEIVNLKKLTLFDIHNTKIKGFVPLEFFNLNNLSIVDLSNTFLCGSYNEDVCGVNSKMDGSVRVIPSCKVNSNMCANCSFCPTICHPLIFKYKFIDRETYEEVTFEKDIYNPTKILCKGSFSACPLTYYNCVNVYNSDNTINKIYFNENNGHIIMTNYINNNSNENVFESVDKSLYDELKLININNYDNLTMQTNVIEETSDPNIQSLIDSPLNSDDGEQYKIQSDFLSVNNETTSEINKNKTTNNPSSSNKASLKFNSTEEIEEYYKNYYNNYYMNYYKKDNENNIIKLITFSCLICWAVGFLLFIVWTLIKHNDSERYCRKCYDFIILIPAAILSFPFSIIYPHVYQNMILT